MRSRATTWRDALDLAGAQAVAWYEDGQLAGWPAVTRHKLGAGEAWYIGAVLDARGMDDVLRQARDVARVAPVATVPAEVRALRRTGPTASYLFLVNHGSIAAAVPSDEAGLDLLSGTRIEKGGFVHLDPLGAAVLRVSRAAPDDRVTGSGAT
jgi:beta-galactosidase